VGGAVGLLGGASWLYEGHLYFERNMRAIFFWLGTLLGWFVYLSLSTITGSKLSCKQHILSRLKLEKYVIHYLNFISNLFIWIYSCGVKFMKHFKGAHAVKVGKPLNKIYIIHKQKGQKYMKQFKSEKNCQWTLLRSQYMFNVLYRESFMKIFWLFQNLFLNTHAYKASLPLQINTVM
jgi:hypothetical protein